MPIDHPVVVVLVDDGAGTLAVERGAATVRALQDFFNGQLHLPVEHLPGYMVRAPYLRGEELDAVSYVEIVTALAGGRDPRRQTEARRDIHNRLQLAVYRVDAGDLITPEAAAHLPYH